MMLAHCKALLRIKSSAFDLEIETLIDACMIDLSSVGIDIKTIDRSLLMVVVGTYVKAKFGLDNKDSEKYMEAYEIMKNQIRLNGGTYVE